MQSKKKPCSCICLEHKGCGLVFRKTVFLSNPVYCGIPPKTISMFKDKFC